MALKRNPKAKSTTVRERSAVEAKPAKTRRLRDTAGKIARPLKAAHRIGKKEYYIPLPDNRAGRFLNKKRSLTPSYFKNAWKELRQVTWPNRKETTQLTIAVFIFAIIFGALVTATDYGLDKIFKRVLLR